MNIQMHAESTFRYARLVVLALNATAMHSKTLLNQTVSFLPSLYSLDVGIMSSLLCVHRGLALAAMKTCR